MTERPMDDAELIAARMLTGVKYPRFTSDERLGSAIQKRLRAAVPLTTKHISHILWRLVHRYRRQIPQQPGRLHMTRLAEKMLVPHGYLEYDRKRSAEQYRLKKAAKFSNIPLA